MELNWTTVVLEILNFLVLVWLLKHFLYKPVKDVIRRRQQGIEEQLQMAGNMQLEAEELKRQYENRLVEWDDERQSMRTQLQSEIERERLRLMAGVQQELAAVKKKNEVLAERQTEKLRHKIELRALELAARFSAKVLNSVASEELQKKLIELLMSELRQLPVEREEALQAMKESDSDMKVQVLSAYSLDEMGRQSLQSYLNSLLECSLIFKYETDPTLIAGLRITVGPWVIHANLHDELKTFATIAHEK